MLEFDGQAKQSEAAHQTEEGSSRDLPCLSPNFVSGVTKLQCSHILQLAIRAAQLLYFVGKQPAIQNMH